MPRRRKQPSPVADCVPQPQRSAARDDLEAARYAYLEPPRLPGSACAGLFPSAGVGMSSPTASFASDSSEAFAFPTTPEVHGGGRTLREAASVSRIKGSGYGAINVRGGL